MNFEAPLFMMLAGTGIIFMVASFIMFKFPPKEINALYGYRTKQSMKSKERWDFAQGFATKEMFKAGLFLLVLGIISAVIDSLQFQNLMLEMGIAMFILFTAAGYMIYTTEQALKNKFKKLNDE